MKEVVVCDSRVRGNDILPPPKNQCNPSNPRNPGSGSVLEFHHWQRLRLPIHADKAFLREWGNKNHKGFSQVFFVMDRSFEQIRTEVLELDHESQRRLVDEVEEKLAEFEPHHADFEEAYQRLEAYRRGEMKSVSAEESIARSRRIIENAKRVRQ